MTQEMMLMDKLPLPDGYDSKYERLRVLAALETFDDLLFAAKGSTHWALSQRRSQALEVLAQLLDRAIDGALTATDLQAVEEWRNEKKRDAYRLSK